ncbi:hypothetical protein [Bombella saccharophila]|uniref:Uncharacterized protein n=1 Tax=Bombella saccharophila TaxID=2967338 RepID=A0ABT3W8G9_9PROT|nr:hypothetical protein [Bombella saccharophila]MCX5615365.1 hypothetical protein [Bombella saccharophila]PHI96610.1 hypothetical protein BG621_02215 [Parasaccharibacter apium]
MTQTYYAIVKAGSDLAQPCQVLGWFAQSTTDGQTTPYQAAPGFEAIPLNISDTEWEARTSGPQNPTQLHEGRLEPYVPPAPSLAVQAQTALQQARAALWNNYGILGESTPDDCVAYIRALTAIAKGKDTTSTALPEAPADLNPS